MLSSLKVRLKRLARRSLWRTPEIYFPVGLLRNRGNVLRSDFQLYISGYPRSGNSFAVKAFMLANPGVSLRSHRHIPAFVVRSVRRSMPGMVMLRNPVDAAISWAIFLRTSVHETLAYYTDYYRILLPYRDALFMVPFEEATTDFGKVIVNFNARWSTHFEPFAHTPANVARCVEQIEADYRDAQGAVVENRVPRPSARRQSEKQRLLAELNNSPVAQEELNRATELYHRFSPRSAPCRPRHSAHTTQSIRLHPAT